jgi:hypothetical protein
VANFLSSPFKGFASLGGIFGRANAAAGVINDPFGITQYGYSNNDPLVAAANKDPEGFWLSQCSTDGTTLDWNDPTKLNAKWQDSAVKNDANDMPENYTTNPCLLLQATIGSAGAFYNNNLLTSEDLASETPSPAPPEGQKDFFFVGDSLTVGMNTLGDLKQKIQTNSGSVTKVEATIGDSLDDAIPKIDRDSELLSTASIVVVELGTNNGESTSASTFTPKISSMISKIRAINPGARIYWMNCYKSGSPTAFSGINKAIADGAQTFGYQVIDWHQEATKNSSKYSPFDSTLHVHPAHYDNLADFVISSAGG